MIARAIAVAFLLLANAPALCVLPDEVLADPVLETRARALSRNIRCLVCQNQSIDNSNADLARDLRILVRDRLKLGDSDQQIFDFLIARYGDFILLKPPFKGVTFLLWFGPGIVFVAAVIGLGVYFRRRKSSRAAESSPGLSAVERERLARLLDDRENSA
jgi:cytochrome c-type biogenesis protein CcmH